MLSSTKMAPTPWLLAGVLLLVAVQMQLILHPGGVARGLPHPDVVQSTCNSTAFYDLCVAALAADPNSSTADVPGLCAIAVSAAAANASATASFLTGAANASSILRTCAAKYANASEALLAARVSLAEEAYDYAMVHVSAAAEYPAVCRTLFRRRRYPPELATREEGLRRLCTIALDIISLLQTTHGH